MALALELAWMVARVGAQARPPLPMPRPLRPLARFAKLPPTALATVRRVLDEDEEFRARVALAAGADAGLDRASWLFVQRPDGWAEELAVLAADTADREASEDAKRADRAALRRVSGLEAALRRAEAAAAASQAVADRLGRELVEERRARKQAQTEAGALRRRAQSLEGERDSARRRAEDADRLALVAEQLESQLAAVERTVTELSEAGPPAPGAPDSTALDRDAVAAAVGDAAAAAQTLGRSLARALAALGEPGAAGTSIEKAVLPAPVAAPRGRSARRQRRHPAALPPAVFDDSPEAAEFLMRVPGVTVLVDGYNATLAVWPNLSIAAQRARLLDAAEELGARTGADIHVVFDGAEQAGDAPPAVRRRAVRWTFSPAGVEADDVLLAMVERVDAGRPLVVASSDKRVQDGTRSRGANVISTPQLFAVLRRDAR